jgi:hypothetical protein
MGGSGDEAHQRKALTQETFSPSRRLAPVKKVARLIKDHLGELPT